MIVSRTFSDQWERYITQAHCSEIKSELAKSELAKNCDLCVSSHALLELLITVNYMSHRCAEIIPLQSSYCSDKLVYMIALAMNILNIMCVSTFNFIRL